jgi:hypothetical protein
MKQAPSALLDFIERMQRPGFRFQGARLCSIGLLGASHDLPGPAPETDDRKQIPSLFAWRSGAREEVEVKDRGGHTAPATPRRGTRPREQGQPQYGPLRRRFPSAIRFTSTHHCSGVESTAIPFSKNISWTFQNFRRILLGRWVVPRRFRRTRERSARRDVDAGRKNRMRPWIEREFQKTEFSKFFRSQASDIPRFRQE